MSYSLFKDDYITKKINTFCLSRDEIILSFLFGSRAKGKDRLLSDFDFAFLVDQTIINDKDCPYGYQSQLATDLIKLFSYNRIDVIILNSAPILLKFQVLRHGKLFFCRSHEHWIEFYLKTFNEYHDFRPYITVQNKYLEGRLLKCSISDRG